MHLEFLEEVTLLPTFSQNPTQGRLQKVGHRDSVAVSSLQISYRETSSLGMAFSVETGILAHLEVR